MPQCIIPEQSKSLVEGTVQFFSMGGVLQTLPSTTCLASLAQVLLLLDGGLGPINDSDFSKPMLGEGFDDDATNSFTLDWKLPSPDSSPQVARRGLPTGDGNGGFGEVGGMNGYGETGGMNDNGMHGMNGHINGHMMNNVGIGVNV